MAEKENRRILVTKRMIKDALIELLKTKDIYHISVRELCESADINRTTFYKYYGSQFDLLTDMESDIISFINRTVTKNNTDIDAIISVICKYLDDNLEFTRLLINNNIDPSFPEKLFSLAAIKDSVLQKYAGRFNQDEIEYLYNYITHGAFRIVCIWLNKENREPAEKLAALIKMLSNNA